MKKTLIIILIIFFSCNTGLKFLNKFDGLNGSPKRVDYRSYEVKYKDNIPIEEFKFQISEFYDSKGRKIKSIMYNSQGEISHGGFHYKYDNDGNLISTVRLNKDGTIASQSISKYDKGGNKIEDYSVEKNSRIGAKKNYTRKNQTEHISMTNKKGEITNNSIIKYDEKGNEIELISYDSHGKQKVRIEYDYDKRNNLCCRKHYNAANKLFKYSNTKFNKHNDPIESISYFISNKDTTQNQLLNWKYTYDSKKNVLESKLFRNNNLVLITRHEYNY